MYNVVFNFHQTWKNAGVLKGFAIMEESNTTVDGNSTLYLYLIRTFSQRGNNFYYTLWRYLFTLICAKSILTYWIPMEYRYDNFIIFELSICKICFGSGNLLENVITLCVAKLVNTELSYNIDMGFHERISTKTY